MNQGSPSIEDILIPHVKSGNTVIFLGAGTSISSGLPSTKELIEKLFNRFPGLSRDINEFNKLCAEVGYTQGYGPKALYRFIQRN